MVPSTIQVPVPHDFVFPHGALGLRVEPVVDFDRRGEADDQARDRATGERLGQVVVMDLDPQAGKYGGAEVRVKITAPHQPVLPASSVPGYPPAVEFADLVLIPYVDTQRCKGNHGQGPHRCRARLAWSIRASGVSAPQNAKTS